jgi:hypothetical protein
MTSVLAALDGSPAARPVLETALRIGHLIGADVEAVHVAVRGSPTPEILAQRLAVPIRVLEPPVDAALLEALAEPGVAIGVLGARGTAGGRRPVGRTALRVLERTAKPIVVVPPEMGPATGAMRRLLVPLEGTAAASEPVMTRLCPQLRPDAELVVLHVFTAATAPAILDRPGRDLDVLRDEFLARHCPSAARVEWRTGGVAAAVADACQDQQADLVVLSWSQDVGATRAAVVRDVLSRSTVPVLLLPAGPMLTGGR